MEERKEPAELSAEEIEAARAEALPDREAMSVLDPGRHLQPMPPDMTIEPVPEDIA